MGNCHVLVLTVDIYPVAVYCMGMPNGRYKVFDSHRRSLLGMGHPLITCTLIEIDSVINEFGATF